MREITVQELKAWMDEGKPFQLIDVREEYEYEWANIGGESIPLDVVLNNIDRIRKTGDVVVHCNSGARAKAIIDVLENKHGFQNLINLEGGIQAWGQAFDSSKLPY